MTELAVPDAPLVRGVIIARLRCCFPFLIIVEPSLVLFFRNGMTCPYAPGTLVRAVYTENADGVRVVDALRPATPGP